MRPVQELDNNGLARLFIGMFAILLLAAGGWAWVANERLARLEVNVENIVKTLEKAKP